MYQALTVIFICCAVCHTFVLGETVPPEAAQFFDGIENSVKSIANFALSNYRNRQGLWNSCNKDTKCSVHACNPLQLYANNSECLAMGVGVCQVTSGNSVGCNNATMATHSYIRLPPRVDETKLPCDVEMTICAQNDLDQQAFKKVYANDSGPFNKIAWSFFGGSNGVFRIYPGLDLPSENCKTRTYDPRKRPWYKAVTAVSKQVVVLLDTGGSMANPLLVTEGVEVQVFTAAQLIVTEFVDTLNEGDIVSVYSFDNTGAKMISPSVNISSIDSENIAALWPLKKAINGTKVSSNAAQANLTAALETILLDGGFVNSNAIVTSLKIILVITGGELAEGLTITIPSPIIQVATTDQVRTFIYRLNDSSQQSDVSKLADLQSVACSLSGSYDQIPRNNILDNPISALGSFYSYVATIRFTLDEGRPLWVPAFKSYSGVGPVMAVVYPVFDGNYLVGVTAIDILRNEVEAKWPGVSWRTAVYMKASQGSPLNCNVSLIPNALVCSDNKISERGLCLDNSLVFANTQLDYVSRTCCDGGCCDGQCDPIPVEKPPVIPDPEGGGSKAAIIGGVIGSAAGVLVLLLLCCYWRPTICGLCSRRIQSSPLPPPLATPSRVRPSPTFNGAFDTYL